MSDPDYRALDGDAGPGAAIRRNSTGGGRILALGIALIGFGLVGYYILPDEDNALDQDPAPTSEEFAPLRAPQQPAFVPPPPPEIPTVQVPVAPPPPRQPPPVQQAPVVMNPPIEPRQPDCEENAIDKANDPQCIELERQKKQLERIRSNVIVVDNGANGDGASIANAVGGQVGGIANNEAGTGNADGNNGGAVDSDRTFLTQRAGAGFETSVANKNRRPDAWIPQGTMIRGTLETAINSDLAGMVKAIVRQDVYSFDGRRILIPAGSSLVGDYKTGVTRGQERIFIVWTRMIRGDGVSVQLGSYGTDALGRSGLTGKVDRKYWERFGPPALLTMVGGFAQYVAALGNVEDNNRTITIVDPTTGSATSVPQNEESGTNTPRRIATETIAAGIQQMAAEAFKDSNAIQPTIHVDQGAEINVFVTRDLDFSDLYPDPVREEFERLRRMRSSK